MLPGGWQSVKDSAQFQHSRYSTACASIPQNPYSFLFASALLSSFASRIESETTRFNRNPYEGFNSAAARVGQHPHGLRPALPAVLPGEQQRNGDHEDSQQQFHSALWQGHSDETVTEGAGG
ncbi:hypothetical protein DVJ83_08430 [Deinococcus wulumuqiensis]|uniref:Uncharacterized protein n=1 Tax=Deinococcus wulumuqiensis TaxID=980427 RepID=A0A345IHK9_9DEIO|nr:hypothetical protein DVJ83_08430 [Deinococcus wulumuqiensis]